MRKALDLRPLEFNDILGRSFSLYTANFVNYLRWLLMVWLIPLVVCAVLFYFVLQPYDWHGIPGKEAPSLFEPNRYAAYIWLLLLINMGLAFSIGAAGIYYMTARVYVGGKPSMGEIMGAVRERFSHTAGAAALHLLILAGIAFIMVLPPILLGKSDKWGEAILLGMLLWTGFIPVVLWYMSRWGLNVPTTVLDDAQAGESFARSSYLTGKFRMRLVGVIVVTVLVVGFPGIPGLLTIPALLAETMLLDADQPLIAILVRLGWDAVLLPLFFVPFVVFYFDQRCRKEGYDLTVMASNFGIAEGEMQRYRFNPQLGYTPKGWKGGHARRQKVVRKPQQRTPAARRAQMGVPSMAWGPQPGMNPQQPMPPQQIPPQPGGWPLQQMPPQQGGWPQQQQPPQQPPQNPNAPPLPQWRPPNSGGQGKPPWGSS